MNRRYQIHHHTIYRYDTSVTFSPHYLRLKPQESDVCDTLSYTLDVSPPCSVYWSEDIIGNHVAKCIFSTPSDILDIRTVLEVSLGEKNPFAFIVDEYAENYPFAYRPYEQNGLQYYLQVQEQGELFTQWVARFSPLSMYVVSMLREVANAIAMEIRYEKRHEPGYLPAEQTLAEKQGSCRDTAWLLMQTLRALGLASRFVSGYLLQPEDDVPDVDIEYHAWVECYIPGAGWVGIDATSGLFTAEHHIALASDAFPENTAAVIGTTSPAISVLDYKLTCKKSD